MSGRMCYQLNPDKFIFVQETVDWAGVRIAKDAVKPLLEHIKAKRTRR